jgi:hypothetical protein
VVLLIGVWFKESLERKNAAAAAAEDGPISEPVGETNGNSGETPVE